MGRFIFGIGGESLAVAQNTYVSNWFDDSELNFIFILQLSVSRIGSTVNFNTMSTIYNLMPTDGHNKLGLSLFLATSTCMFSLFCAIFLGIFDKRREKILNKNREVSINSKIF